MVTFPEVAVINEAMCIQHLGTYSTLMSASSFSLLELLQEGTYNDAMLPSTLAPEP